MADITIVGALAGQDLILAEHLSRKGLKCQVLRKIGQEPASGVTALGSYHTHFQQDQITYYRNSVDFVRHAWRSRLICSFSGSLIGALGRLWVVRKALFLPPIVHVMTGSDMTELLAEDSSAGRRFRAYLHFTRLNWCVPYPHAVKNIVRFQIPNVVFLNYTYYLPDLNRTDAIDRTIRFFHPSHLDWRENDPGENRNSQKGNDRFIRAFIKAIRSGKIQAHCVLLDRGPDRESAKRIIRDLGGEEYFTWKPHLSRDELFTEYGKADVVVDQFDVGGFGGISIEAMSMGKAVFVHIDSEYARLSRNDDPPILNCHTEDEIYEQLLKCTDRKQVQNIGNLAREWILRNYSPDRALDPFCFYYSLLTGHQISGGNK